MSNVDMREVQFFMPAASKSGGYPLSEEERVWLSLLERMLGMLELAYSRMCEICIARGKPIKGSPPQVISSQPGKIKQGLMDRDPVMIQIVQKFGIDIYKPLGEQDVDAIRQICLDYKPI